MVSARAIASICCSPPDSVPASCLRRSRRRGKRRERAVLELRHARARVRRHAEVLGDGEVREDARGPRGSRHTPGAGERVGRRPGHRRADRAGPRPRSARSDRSPTFERRRLAGAVGTEQREHRPVGQRRGRRRAAPRCVPYPARTSLSSSGRIGRVGAAAAAVARRRRRWRGLVLLALRRGTPSAPCRSACTSLGVPTAMMRPKSSTWIRSHVPMTNDMSCSTSSTASRRPRSSRNKVPRVSVSDSSRPADGSSSSSTRGCVAERASQLDQPGACPVGSRSTRVVRRLLAVPPARGSRRRSPRRALAIVRPPAPHLGRHEDVLARGQAPERLEPLERAPDPEPRPLVGLAARDVATVELDPARVRRRAAR